PLSTNTANAMSPCQPITQACACAGLLSYSAVPVFAYTGPPGTPINEVAVPAATTSRIIDRSAATASGFSGGPAGGDAPGAGSTSVGGSHDPCAIAAAALARLAALTKVWPWPKAAAADSTGDALVATDPVNASVPRRHGTPMPTEAAAFASPSVP